jgi:hypothetical protein
MNAQDLASLEARRRALETRICNRIHHVTELGELDALREAVLGRPQRAQRNVMSPEDGDQTK